MRRLYFNSRPEQSIGILPAGVTAASPGPAPVETPAAPVIAASPKGNVGAGEPAPGQTDMHIRTNYDHFMSLARLGAWFHDISNFHWMMGHGNTALWNALQGAHERGRDMDEMVRQFRDPEVEEGSLSDGPADPPAAQ